MILLKMLETELNIYYENWVLNHLKTIYRPLSIGIGYFG